LIKNLAKRLTDVNHIIGFGQSLMAGINSMPLQTITAIPNAYRFNGGVRAQEGSGTSAENHASLLPYIETTHDTGMVLAMKHLWAGPLLRYLTACLLKPMGTRQVT
jgi:hypothetical protein